MNNSPQLNPEDDDSISQRLEREHLRPASVFQGKELWPFTRGTKLVFNQIIGDDTVLFRALAFVWIHVKRGEATCKADVTRHVAPFAWSINHFRGEIIEFADTLTDEDQADAMRIHKEWEEAEAATRFKAGAIGGKSEITSEKKTESTPGAPLGESTP